MAKTKNLKITIKLYNFKKKKPKRFLENWYKKLNEFVESKNN